MTPFSIVIVAKDSADKIGRLLHSLDGLSDDVLVCDTGSSDNTVSISESLGARVQRMPWQGYGKSKNQATQFAIHDWILSLDSDEKIDADLYKALKEWKPVNEQTVHQVIWKNFFAGKWIRHSDWGNNWKNRLFHRKYVNWNDAIAHEDLISDHKIQYQQLPGFLEHYSFRDTRDYASKMINSAMITAEKYHSKGRKASFTKVVFAPLFSFIKTYFFKKGFLDGYNGWMIAVTTAYYSFIKYVRLRELNKKDQ